MSQTEPITTPTTRRIRRVDVNVDILGQWVRQDMEITFKCVSGIPDDATLIHVALESDGRTVALFFEHESFSGIATGLLVPDFICEFERL